MDIGKRTAEADNEALRADQGDTPPQLRLENQLCFPMYACARKIVNLYTPYLKPLGITYTQYLVFMTLWEYGDTTVGALCRRLYLDNGTLSPLLKKMEESGYIMRRRSSEDERVVDIILTKEGLDFRSKVENIPYGIGGCIPLSPEESLQLYTLLYKVLREI